MRKIVVATEKDMSALTKCFRRVQAGLEERGDFHYSHGYPNDEFFLHMISDHILYIMKDNGRVLGLFGIAHNVTDYFCSVTHSERKTEDLLELVHYEGEKVTIIESFMVDPAYWGSGLSDELCLFIKSKYKHTSFLFAVFGDDIHSRSFWLRHGFKDFGTFEEQEWPLREGNTKCRLMGKPLEKVGLCTGKW